MTKSTTNVVHVETTDHGTNWWRGQKTSAEVVLGDGRTGRAVLDCNPTKAEVISEAIKDANSKDIPKK